MSNTTMKIFFFFFFVLSSKIAYHEMKGGQHDNSYNPTDSSFIDALSISIVFLKQYITFNHP